MYRSDPSSARATPFGIRGNLEPVRQYIILHRKTNPEAVPLAHLLRSALHLKYHHFEPIQHTHMGKLKIALIECDSLAFTNFYKGRQ